MQRRNLTRRFAAGGGSRLSRQPHWMAQVLGAVVAKLGAGNCTIRPAVYRSTCASVLGRGSCSHGVHMHLHKRQPVHSVEMCRTHNPRFIALTRITYKN